MSLDAMKQALEALETNHYAVADAARHLDVMAHNDAIDALRLAIEQAEKQEPVAWQWLNTAHFRKKLPKDAERGAWNALYIAPPQRYPLTEEEIARACLPLGAAMLSFTEVARAIERAHGIGGEE
jgi:hypothetical protein